MDIYYGIQIAVDGQTTTLTDANGNIVYPFTSNGTTYVPIRAISELLGANVWYDSVNKIAHIESPEYLLTHKPVQETEINTSDPEVLFAEFILICNQLYNDLINIYGMEITEDSGIYEEAQRLHNEADNFRDSDIYEIVLNTLESAGMDISKQFKGAAQSVRSFAGAYFHYVESVLDRDGFDMNMWERSTQNWKENAADDITKIESWYNQTYQ